MDGLGYGPRLSERVSVHGTGFIAAGVLDARRVELHPVAAFITSRSRQAEEDQAHHRYAAALKLCHVINRHIIDSVGILHVF